MLSGLRVVQERGKLGMQGVGTLQIIPSRTTGFSPRIHILEPILHTPLKHKGLCRGYV